MDSTPPPDPGIVAATGNCRLINLYCRSCSLPSSSWSKHARYHWCISLYCDNCKKLWYVCKICNSTRSYYDKPNSLRHHATKFHMLKTTTIPTKRKRRRETDTDIGTEVDEDHSKEAAVDEANNDDSDSYVFNENSPNELLPPLPSEDSNSDADDEDQSDDEKKPKAIDFSYLGNQPSINYFSHEIIGNGNRYLVSLSQFKSPINLGRISDDDAALQLLIARFSNNLKMKQQSHLTEILKHVDRRIPAKSLKLETGIACELPKSSNELRSMYFEGKHAIKSNLPIPTIHVAGDYCYVRIHDVIANLLAHGADVYNVLDEAPQPPTHHFNYSKRVLDFREKCMSRIDNSQLHNVIALWMSWWSDAFEPNTSNKGNRLSVWIKTITISRPCSLGGNDITNTFPIAIGPKNGSKDAVEKAIMEDLKLLSLDHVDNYTLLPKMFDRKSGHVKYICAHVLLCIHDQIDRRGTLNLAHGNARLHPMFGWSFDFTQHYSVVAACPTCIKSLAVESKDDGRISAPYWWRTGNCRNCTSWFHHRDSKLLCSPIPAALKKCYENQSSQDIKPIKLNYHFLQAIVTHAHAQLRDQKWTQAQTEAYLKMHCIPAEYNARLIKCATTSAVKRFLDLNLETTTNSATHMLSDHYETLDMPPLWDDLVPLDSYVESPMHLLFLGIVESVVKLIHEWCARRRLGTTFVKYANKVLKELITLQVPWCKIMPYSPTGKFGGWVSENYLGFSRIIKWFYSVVLEVDDNAEDYIEPTKPVDSWTNEECNEFMLHNGMRQHINNVLTIRHLIKEKRAEINAENLPRRKASKQSVVALLVCLSNMLESVMDDTILKVMNVRSVEVDVRLFLTAFDDFDRMFNKYPYGHPKYVPGWVTKYNFLALLKLPEMIKEFGPVRGIWEGGAMGEGFLRYIKPEISSGLRFHWQQWILNNFLEKKAFDMISRDTSKSEQSDYNDLFKIYPSVAAAIRKFKSGTAVSLVAYGCEIGIVCRSENQVFVLEVRCTGFVTCIMSLNYFRFELRIEERRVHKFLLSSLPTPLFGAILLPRVKLENFELKHAGHPESTLITSNWRSIVGV
jgi:hypothetical protein